MAVTIAIAGKPNAGKSTFFKAATLADVEIASYPFTTISPNVGIAHVRVPCPCKELLHDSSCGNCVRGVRFIPVELIDVAGLVRGAHEGRGLGNEFLDELRRAEAIIHVVDASGGTDTDGNVVQVGSHDPIEDIRAFKEELNMWVFMILKRSWHKLTRKAELEGTKIERAIAEQLAGVGVTEEQIKAAILSSRIPDDFRSWDEEALKSLSAEIIKLSKKMVIAANKADLAQRAALKKLKALEGEGETVIPCSAAAELALRTAAKHKFVRYLPGDPDFEILHTATVTAEQRAGLEKIMSLINDYGSTGVQAIINQVVFQLLNYIVAYPVEDEHKFTDSSGRILPDAYLMKRGSTAKDLAYAVHSDIGEGFLYAIDARTKRRLGERYELEDSDVIKVVYAQR